MPSKHQLDTNTAEAELFPGLSSYNNYRQGSVPRRGIRELQLNGTIRIVKQLGIPFRDVVMFELFAKYPKKVGYAIPARYSQRLNRALNKTAAQKRERKEMSSHPDLILCIREASKKAHACRDAAAESYWYGRHHNASEWSQQKREWYELKDQGIVEAHKRGLLRYAGETKQGLAVYEYDNGGMACFHSTLHPVDVERSVIEDHIILVATKEKRAGISLERVRVTLSRLDDDCTGYVRSDSPAIKKPSSPVTCWNCGEAGHTSRDCDADSCDDKAMAS